ncbi:MAG: hypothetical protein J3K34DRAFT_526986 [Monoraphidium minutum]|nr:MAG: hypothetical protein J3K34DRAFT_526986 [Monoraphidium minutum]
MAGRCPSALKALLVLAAAAALGALQAHPVAAAGNVSLWAAADGAAAAFFARHPAPPFGRLLLQACASSADCANPAPHCDVGTCQPCLDDAHCGAGSVCGASGSCVRSECESPVARCVECTFRRFGASTKAYCNRCADGYAIATRGVSAGRACWCAPGYYKDGDACRPCGAGYWCPGALYTEASGAVRVECGAHKTTTSQIATASSNCVAQPGYGWAAGDATACLAGLYNPGSNSRRCARCPGGLTTPGQLAVSPTDCVAPPGHTYVRGKAVACGRGFFKPAVGNGGCTACPTGFSTAPGQVAKQLVADCNYLLPGYTTVMAADAGDGSGALSAEECPPGTFRAGDQPLAPGQAVSCTPCGAGLGTRGQGHSSEDACLALPGYGFDAVARAGVICPLGSYNLGWNKEPCRQCGAGTVTTAVAGAAGPDQCLTPAGDGSRLLADGATLSGAPCPAGTYGRPQPTFGLVPAECTKCPENTLTVAEGSSSSVQCLAQPGYGYSDGRADLCAPGSYSPGGGQAACTPCGQGLTTLAAGAASPADCVLAEGWADTSKPCAQGTYKPSTGPGACAACPAGTTTLLATGATALAQCDVCLPGYAAASISPAAPWCGICPSGTYSGGGAGGAACTPCTPPASYSGVMVSRRGATGAGFCFPEMATDAATALLEWDHIPMLGSGVFTAVNDLFTAGVDTPAACEARCAAAPSCQYLVHNASAAAGGRCLLRNLGTDAAAFGDPTQPKILFQVTEGSYVAYQAHASDWALTGADLATYSTQAAALAACYQAPACIGVKYDIAGGVAPWKTVQPILCPRHLRRWQHMQL